MRVFLFLPVFCFVLLFNGSFRNPEPPKDNFFKAKPVNFSLKDTAGNVVNISDFKGKFVHIDLWASFCRPCLAEIEPTNALMNQFKDENIAWVFISFDRDERTWKKAVKERNLKGIQLYGTPQKEMLKKEFNIPAIPYYIWLDEEGRVVMEDAPRPSAGIVKQLRKYMK